METSRAMTLQDPTTQRRSFARRLLTPSVPTPRAAAQVRAPGSSTPVAPRAPGETVRGGSAQAATAVRARQQTEPAAEASARTGSGRRAAKIAPEPPEAASTSSSRGRRAARAAVQSAVKAETPSAEPAGQDGADDDRHNDELFRELQGLGLWNKGSGSDDEAPPPEWSDDQENRTSTASYGMADGSMGAGPNHYDGGEEGDDGEEDDLTPEDLEALRALQVQVEDEADADKILGQGIPQSLPQVSRTSIETASPQASSGGTTMMAEPSPSVSDADPLSALAQQIDWTSARQEALGLGAVGVRRRRGGGAGGAAAVEPEAPLKSAQPAGAPEPSVIAPEAPSRRIAAEETASASRPASAGGVSQADKSDPAELPVTLAVADLLQETSANALTLNLDQLQELGLAARARPRDTIRRVLQPWLADVTAHNCFPGWALSWEADNLVCTRIAPLPTKRKGADTPVPAPASTPHRTRSKRYSSRAAIGATPMDMGSPRSEARSDGSDPSTASPPPPAAVSRSEDAAPGDAVARAMSAKVINREGGLSGTAAALQDLEDEQSDTDVPDDRALEDDFVARVEAAVAARIEQVLGERVRQMDQQMEERLAAFERAIATAAGRIAEQAVLQSKSAETSMAPARTAGTTDLVPADGDGSEWIAAAGSPPVTGWEAIRQGDRVLPPLLLAATGVVIGIAMPIAAWMTAVLTPLAVCLVYLIGRRDETGQMSAGAALAAGLALLYAAERFRAGHLEATLDALARALGGS